MDEKRKEIKKVLLGMGFLEDEKLDFAVRNSESVNQAIEFYIGGGLISNTGGSSMFSGNIFETFSQPENKMVIAMRKDLKLSVGKIAAQAVHAALGAVRIVENSRKKKWQNCLAGWQISGEKTIVVQVANIQELKKLHNLANDSNIPVSQIIADAGRTQIDSGTLTCFAMGPALSSDIDKISGGCKLY